MALPDLDFGQARRILGTHFSYPPTNETQAKGVIENYHSGATDLLPKSTIKLIEVYWALQILTCLGMRLHHAADPKRKDRSFGQMVRKNRTGSRRG